MSTYIGWFFIGVTLFFELFFGIIPFVGFILQIILIATVIFIIRRVFSKNAESWKQEVFRTARIICIFFGACITFFLGFLSYQIYNPGYLSDIVITNGEKRVHFLSMSHIATDSFYEEKKEKIALLNASGSIFYVEGVAPGSEESHNTFNKSLGMDFTNELYETFARVTGLQMQENEYLMTGVDMNKIRNVDMSMDEIATYLTGSAMLTESGSVAVNIPELIQTFENMNGQEKIFVRYVLRAFFNWNLKNTASIESAIMAGSKAELFDVILIKRNDRIINAIHEGQDKEVVVIYGALHFPGILNGLKKQDPKWHIESFESSAPYRGE